MKREVIVDVRENAMGEKAITHAEAVKEFWALNIGLDALVRSSGAGTNSASRYMNKKLAPGVAYDKIDRALCRILQVDKIINFGKLSGGE